MKVSYNFELVMSLLAMSLGFSFCASRKGRWVGFNTWVKYMHVACLLQGLAAELESPWLGLSGPFLSSFERMGLEDSLLAM